MYNKLIKKKFFLTILKGYQADRDKNKGKH